MSVKRKAGRVRVTTDDATPEARAAVAEIMGNLTPDAQLQRMYKQLELARSKGMPKALYDILKDDLDGRKPGHLDFVRKSIKAWRAKESRSRGGTESYQQYKPTHALAARYFRMKRRHDPKYFSGKAAREVREHCQKSSRDIFKYIPSQQRIKKNLQKLT